MSKDRNSRDAVTSRGDAGVLAKFARWRRERPFWGATLAIVAGVEIYSAAAAPMNVVVMQGLPGLLTIIVALVAVIMGAVTLFQPVQRAIAGWVVVILGPISILATNLGGFVIGMIMLVVGGSLMLSWQAPGTAAAAEDTTAVPATVHSPLVADESYSPPEDRAYAPTETYAPAEPYAPTEPVGYGTAVAAEAPPAEPGATRNPWRTTTTPAPAEPAPEVQPAADDTHVETYPEPEPVVEPEPVSYTEPEPVPAEAVDPEPVPSEPVSSEPVSSEPVSSEPVADDEDPVTRNPWRSRTPPPAGSTGFLAEDREAEPATSRSWFNGSPSEALSPMEPPKNLIRTTLLIPVILVSLAVSGLVAAPAHAATAPQAGLLDWLFPPAATPTPAPAPAPSAAPSATPSSGLQLPQLPDLDLFPGGDDAKPPAAGDGAELPAADCPTALLPGTTAGGDAAIDGAAAIQACQAAGETAAVAAAEGGDPQNVSGEISIMKASRLEMSDFKYNGIKTLNTAKGPLRTLSFSVGTLKVNDYDHVYPNSFGRTALKDGPQTVLKGDVRLYVTSMTGNIYGLIPLTFTPDFAPPLVLPSMFFTETESKVVYVSANTILLPKFGLEMAD